MTTGLALTLQDGTVVSNTYTAEQSLTNMDTGAYGALQVRESTPWRLPYCRLAVWHSVGVQPFALTFTTTILRVPVTVVTAIAVFGSLLQHCASCCVPSIPSREVHLVRCTFVSHWLTPELVPLGLPALHADTQ